MYFLVHSLMFQPRLSSLSRPDSAVIALRRYLDMRHGARWKLEHHRSTSREELCENSINFVIFSISSIFNTFIVTELVHVVLQFLATDIASVIDTNKLWYNIRIHVCIDKLMTIIVY